MRLDRLRIAVRPRGTLECLDLAVLVCGRRPLGVAAAVALGAVPMILLNRAAFGRIDVVDRFPLAVLATAMEMPWAAVPLTLFLGTNVFSEHVTPGAWRDWCRGGAGAVGPMLLYQGLLRGLAIVTCFCISGPAFLAAAYYLGPVILLERGGIGGIPRRCLALARRDLGRTLLALVIDTAVLVVGWIVGTMFLDSVVSLWRGGTIAEALAAVLDRLANETDDSSLAAAFVSWPSQLAFWAAAALVTAFRFFTYLDTRIRHEGWDVELMLRDPGTYAGLGSRGTIVAVLLVAAVAGVPPSTAVAAPAVAAATATSDELVRDAVVKQRFPWYDAAADRYRPMIRVEPETPPLPRWAPDPGMLGEVTRLVMIALLVAAVGGAIWLVVRHGLGWSTPDAVRPHTRAAILGAEAIEALPDAVRRHDGDLLGEAARLADAGDFAAAMVLFHGWQLVQLHGRGVIELARGKTNGRYAAEVAASAPAVGGLFRRSCRLFEDALFGRLPVAGAAFGEIWRRRGEFVAAEVTEAAP